MAASFVTSVQTSILSGSVLTFPAITAGVDQAYVLVTNARRTPNITSVVGGGLVWTQQKRQCSGRGQIQVQLWTARGSPGAPFVVTATYDGTEPTKPKQGIVGRYTGTKPVTPFEAAVGQNTVGIDDVTCVGGTDDVSPILTISPTLPNSLLVVGSSPRNGAVTVPDPNYTSRAFTTIGAGGDATDLELLDRLVAAAGPSPFGVTISMPEDWANNGIALNGAAAPAGGDSKLADVSALVKVSDVV